MASNLDKLAGNLCGTSGIQCDKCKGNMELINILATTLHHWGVRDAEQKKRKYLNEGALKKNFNHTSRLLGCDEKFCLTIRKVFTHTNIWMVWKNLRRQVYHRKTRFTAGLI